MTEVLKDAGAARSCPACGAPLDPLRANAVLLFEDGFRYFCSSGCADDFRLGKRSTEGSRDHRRGFGEKPSKPRGARTARQTISTEPAKPMTAHDPWAKVGFFCSALAALGALFERFTLSGWISAVLSGTVAAIALWLGHSVRKEVGWAAWLFGPVGVMLAAVAAEVGPSPSSGAWLLHLGAAVASGAVLGRVWLDVKARRPVAALARELRGYVPDHVHVPNALAQTPTDTTYEKIPANRIRAGQEALALEGDVVGVDGVVTAGEARVLLHPDASTVAKRRPGDPLLSGARVLEGGVKLLATRVGDERALIRPLGFGLRSSSEANEGPVARITSRVSSFGALFTVAAVLASVLLNNGAPLAVRLSSIAAVLLAAPLLAIRRASELPMVAAAASAARRGIIFKDAPSLERAGRVSVAALCTRGTVHEDEPDVIEVVPVGDGTRDELLATVVAAESSVSERPIATAILRYASTHDIAIGTARRATFVPGRGLTAVTADGNALVVGNRQLLLEHGVSFAAAEEEANRAEAKGYTVLFVGERGRIRGMVFLQGALKAGARAAVQRIMDLQVEVVLLSGDHRGTVETLAKGFDIAHVKAELGPEDRGREVERLRETGELVAVIGRGEFDQAALSAGDVPIVLEGAGSVTGEGAIALTTGDLRDAAGALWIARAARDATWRASSIAIGAFAFIVSAATVGLAPPAISALGSLLVDSVALPTGSRLLKRVALRLPARA